MTDAIVIGSQYYGFPGVGFGGYVSGRLAELAGGGAVEVTLRSPPPLERPMRVTPEDERLALRDGDTLVAEALAAPLDVAPPRPISFHDAAAASEGFAGFRTHPFPMCFCCGTDRADGAGLRIFPGPLPGGAGAAAPWIPHERFADPDGTIRSEFVWSALDCPTYWGMALDGGDILVLTTGRIHTEVVAPVRAGERHVVVGWPVSSDGRKHLGGAALFSEDGELRAFSKATWLALPKRSPEG